MSLNIAIIKQLTDNYSYIVYSKNSKKAIVFDPAVPEPIFDYLNINKLSLEGILATHHHSDHTQGILEIKNKLNIKVYTPNKNIDGTTHLLKENQIIKFSFVNFKIIATPGHTLDHVVFFSNEEKLLFSGDTLFQYGCGRIFEGTYEQMLMSLNKLKSLPSNTKVYCGHEYTYKNLEFIFNEIVTLPDKNKILLDYTNIMNKLGTSMPFELGQQKNHNPFLNCDNIQYQKKIIDFPKNKGKISSSASELEFFTYIREKRNKY